MTDAYAAAGVDVAAADQLKRRLGELVISTWNGQVRGAVGGFAAGLELPGGALLMASSDGVGTKTLLARDDEDWRGIGRDAVNHGIDDLLCSGAEPIGFLDYVAQGRLEPRRVEALVEGMAEACRVAGCPLLGGETAELPDIYRPDVIDVAGTVLGLVSAGELLGPARVRAGDLLVGWASTGLHTNGYSLARRLLGDRLEEEVEPGLSLRLALLAEHRSYLEPMRRLRLAAGSGLHSAAHITGGGWPGNLPRALPAHLGAEVEARVWPRPAIFGILAQVGGLGEEELAGVFNLGVGMVAVVAPEAEAMALAALPGESWRVGRVVEQPGVRWL